VPPGCRELERAPSSFLAADVGEIERAASRFAVPDDELRRFNLPAKIGDRLGEVPHSDGLNAGKRGLGTGIVRTQEPLDARAARALCYGKHASDPPEPSVKGELPAGGVLSEAVAGDLPGCGEERERDRQVECGALLLQVGGSQVDRRFVPRPLELGRFDAAPHAQLRLLAGAIGESDEGERRNAALHVRLDLDASWLEAY